MSAGGEREAGSPGKRSEGLKGIQSSLIIIFIIFILGVPLPLLSFDRRRILVCRGETKFNKNTNADSDGGAVTLLTIIPLIVLILFVFLAVHISVHLSVLQREQRVVEGFSRTVNDTADAQLTANRLASSLYCDEFMKPHVSVFFKH